MTNNIKVSIIVPVYNTSTYLAKCLESLINQTLLEVEIICVDDGSTDNSAKILESFAHENKTIKFFTKKNQGQSVARNFGIKQAKGEYVGFLDSDDWADETMFEKLYENAKKYNSDIAMCSINTYDNKTREISTKDPYLTLDLFDEKFENRAFNQREVHNFIFRICVTPWNKIYKRDFLIENNILFPEGLAFEDNIFNLETIVKSERISLLKEPLVYYRKWSGYSSTPSEDKKKLAFFEIMELEETILKEAGLFEKLKDYFLTSKKNTLIYWYKKLTVEEIKEEYQKKLQKLYPDYNFQSSIRCNN